MLRISKLTYGAVKEILAVIVSTRKEVLFFDAMLDKSIKNKTDAKVIAVINPDSFIQAKLPNKKKKKLKIKTNKPIFDSSKMEIHTP